MLSFQFAKARCDITTYQSSRLSIKTYMHTRAPGFDSPPAIHLHSSSIIPVAQQTCMYVCMYVQRQWVSNQPINQSVEVGDEIETRRLEIRNSKKPQGPIQLCW